MHLLTRFGGIIRAAASLIISTSWPKTGHSSSLSQVVSTDSTRDTRSSTAASDSIGSNDAVMWSSVSRCLASVTAKAAAEELRPTAISSAIANTRVNSGQGGGDR